MNFALLLFVLLLVTGVVALVDRIWLAGRRAEGEKEPWWVEYGKSFFPVILIVFFLRSFLVEPFKIPSGSMIPTLLVGDFILVNKYTYGVRIPIINRKILDINSPRRGDVMVFRYPDDPSLDYIKRVVGLPGDRIGWIDKRLVINGVAAPRRAVPDYLHPERMTYSKQFLEKTGDVTHPMLIEDGAPAAIPFIKPFPFRENCNYNSNGVECTVPPGHYYMMGDNRDNSADSRFWGFVPEENIVGKAFFIWFNFGEPSRFGSFK